MMLKSVLLALQLLTVFHEDKAESPEKRAQLTGLAYSIAEFSRDADTAAFLIVWAKHETNLSLRIQVGRCKAWECDRGKARGPWQQHRNGRDEETWNRMIGVENTRVQAREAAKQARWALGRCKGDARCAFRMLGGLAPTTPLKGEEKRVADFERTRRRL